MSLKEKLNYLSELPREGPAFEIYQLLSMNLDPSQIVVETLLSENEVKDCLEYLENRGFIDWYSLKHDDSFMRGSVLDPLYYKEDKKMKIAGTPFEERVYYKPLFRRPRKVGKS